MATPKFKILFDAHPLLGQKTGIGYYTSQLIEAMARQHPDVEFIGYYHNFLFRKKSLAQPSAPNIRYRQIGFIPGQIVNALRRAGLRLPIEVLTSMKTDFILYSNYLGHPSLFKTPYAPAIHDLTFIDHPESMSDKNRQDLTNYVPGMVKDASFVITVSEFSKMRLQADLKVKAPVVVTPIPPSAPLELSPAKRQAILAPLNIPERFILFLGTIEPRKNITALLDAYTLLPESIRKTTGLVIVGKTDWKFDAIKQKMAQLQSQGEHITYLGYVDDQTRAALYASATIFTLPSIYEGFGMPILEAFSYGTRCVVSDIPVFHEVAGDAAAYFDPLDPHSIASSLRQELEAPSITQKQISDQLARYSWDSVANLLYHHIEAAINKTGSHPI